MTYFASAEEAARVLELPFLLGVEADPGILERHGRLSRYAAPLPQAGRLYHRLREAVLATGGAFSATAGGAIWIAGPWGSLEHLPWAVGLADHLARNGAIVGLVEREAQGPLAAIASGGRRVRVAAVFAEPFLGARVMAVSTDLESVWILEPYVEGSAAAGGPTTPVVAAVPWVVVTDCLPESLDGPYPSAQGLMGTVLVAAYRDHSRGELETVTHRLRAAGHRLLGLVGVGPILGAAAAREASPARESAESPDVATTVETPTVPASPGPTPVPVSPETQRASPASEVQVPPLSTEAAIPRAPVEVATPPESVEVRTPPSIAEAPAPPAAAEAPAAPMPGDLPTSQVLAEVGPGPAVVEPPSAPTPIDTQAAPVPPRDEPRVREPEPADLAERSTEPPPKDEPAPPREPRRKKAPAPPPGPAEPTPARDRIPSPRPEAARRAPKTRQAGPPSVQPAPSDETSSVPSGPRAVPLLTTWDRRVGADSQRRKGLSAVLAVALTLAVLGALYALFLRPSGIRFPRREVARPQSAELGTAPGVSPPGPSTPGPAGQASERRAFGPGEPVEDRAARDEAVPPPPAESVSGVTGQTAPAAGDSLIPDLSELAPARSAGTSGSAAPGGMVAEAGEEAVLTSPVAAAEGSPAATKAPSTEALERAVEPTPPLPGQPLRVQGDSASAPPDSFPTLATTPRTGRFVIHLSSFKLEQEASDEVARLQALGVMARALRVEVPDRGSWYRILTGDFASFVEAENAALVLQARGFVPYAHIADDGGRGTPVPVGTLDRIRP